MISIPHFNKLSVCHKIHALNLNEVNGVEKTGNCVHDLRILIFFSSHFETYLHIKYTDSLRNALKFLN